MTEYSNENTGVTFTNTTGKGAPMKGHFCLNDEDKTHLLTATGRMDKELGLYLDVELVEFPPEGGDWKESERFGAKLFSTGQPTGPKFKGVFTLPNGDDLPIVVWGAVNGKTNQPMLRFKTDTGTTVAVNTDQVVDIFGDAQVATTAADIVEPVIAVDSFDSFDLDVPF